MQSSRWSLIIIVLLGKWILKPLSTRTPQNPSPLAKSPRLENKNNFEVLQEVEAQDSEAADVPEQGDSPQVPMAPRSQFLLPSPRNELLKYLFLYILRETPKR